MTQWGEDLNSVQQTHMWTTVSDNVDSPRRRASGVAIYCLRNKKKCDTMHYPTLGCDIQGFRAMGLSVQYWPRWFQDFRRSDWLYHLEQNWAHLGIWTLPEFFFFVWNKLFLCEIKFSQTRSLPVKSLCWQIVPMQESTNECKNLTIFLNNGTCGSQW